MIKINIFREKFNSRVLQKNGKSICKYKFRFRDFYFKKFYTGIGDTFYFKVGVDGYGKKIVETHYLFSTPIISLRIDIKPNTV